MLKELEITSKHLGKYCLKRYVHVPKNILYFRFQMYQNQYNSPFEWCRRCYFIGIAKLSTICFVHVKIFTLYVFKKNILNKTGSNKKNTYTLVSSL
jgi:hypothetical protein